MSLEEIIKNFIETKSKTDVDFKNKVESLGKNVEIEVAHKCTEHARKLASGKGCYGVDDKTLYSWIFEAIMDGAIGEVVQDVNVPSEEVEEAEEIEAKPKEAPKVEEAPKPKKTKKKEQTNGNQMSLFDFIN